MPYAYSSAHLITTREAVSKHLAYPLKARVTVALSEAQHSVTH
jgi:hypothetical protein